MLIQTWSEAHIRVSYALFMQTLMGNQEDAPALAEECWVSITSGPGAFGSGQSTGQNKDNYTDAASNKFS